MGHMNVRFYLGKAQQGLAHVGHWVGLGPEVLRERDEALVIRQQHIRYLRELHAGADLSIEAGIAYVEDRSFSVFQEILPLATSGVSATLTSTLTLEGALRNDAHEIPATSKELMAACKTEVPDYAKPRSFEFDVLIPVEDEAEALVRGHLNVSQATIKRAQVDGQGYLYPDEFIGHISDGIGNLFGMMTKNDDGIFERTEKVGGAALEYRFDYYTYPRVGDLLTVLSAPVELSEKVYKLRHLICNPATGAVYAKAESVHCSFDLELRKAIPVPDRLRRGLEKHLAP